MKLIKLKLSNFYFFVVVRFVSAILFFFVTLHMTGQDAIIFKIRQVFLELRRNR